MKKGYPSDRAERFQIRLPAGMRDQIRSVAEQRGRSMNAEIVRRLESSFTPRARLDRVMLDTIQDYARRSGRTDDQEIVYLIQLGMRYDQLAAVRPRGEAVQEWEEHLDGLSEERAREIRSTIYAARNAAREIERLRSFLGVLMSSLPSDLQGDDDEADERED